MELVFELCLSDCTLYQGQPSNPRLTVYIKNSQKHITNRTILLINCALEMHNACILCAHNCEFAKTIKQCFRII